MILRVAAFAKPQKTAWYNRASATLFDIVNKAQLLGRAVPAQEGDSYEKIIRESQHRD